jgi:hypothetical protein
MADPPCGSGRRVSEVPLGAGDGTWLGDGLGGDPPKEASRSQQTTTVPAARPGRSDNGGIQTMSKKLSISLAPLVAIAAFVVMPAAAQAAAPHYFVSGAPLAAGDVKPVLAWGTLTLNAELPSKQGPSSCENASGGNVENPGGVAGPAGRGKTLDFASWNCTNPGCPPGEVEFPPGSSKKVGKEFIVFPGPTVIPPKVGGYSKESLPWPNELIESPTALPSKIRLKSEGVVVVLGCIAPRVLEVGPPFGGDTDADAPAFLAAPTTCFTVPGLGKQEPIAENGTQQGGTNTASLIFDEPNDGKLQCSGPKSPTESETVSFKGNTIGILKVFGYNEQEIINSCLPAQVLAGCH